MTGAAPVGQGEAFARLLRQARALDMHHGVLITGAAGAGKTTCAEYLARALLCTGTDPEAPCGDTGACPSCTHFANHPDLWRIGLPEEKDEIPVDLVRELCEGLQRASVEGRARVAILDPADRLNVQGQNALLKTLEEPGRRTFLLLPVRSPEALLETVRSRVSELRVLPLVDQVLEGLLAETVADPDRRAALVDFAGGSLGRARLLASEEIFPVFELIRGYLLDRRGTPVTTARAALDGASGRIESVDRARLVLWIAATILRKELWRVLAPTAPGPYVAAASVRCTSSIETLLQAEADLSLRIPPEQVLANAFAAV